MALSVVIPVYQLIDTIHVTLAALDGQTLPRSEFECIFVDDGSSDGTSEAIERWRTDITFAVVRNRQNLGRSQTRNRGWRTARGDLVVFLDGDMVAHPELLQSYMRRFETDPAEVVSGRRWHFDRAQVQGPFSSSLAELVGATDLAFLREGSIHEFDVFMRHCRLGAQPNPIQFQLESQLQAICQDHPTSLTRALAVVTGSVAVRRGMLQRCGGFYPFLPTGEDTDLGVRLARLGAKVVYAPEAQAVHLYSASKRGASAQYRWVFETMVVRHPFIAVVLWYIWALRMTAPDSPPFLSSLLEIARMETDGSIQEIDVRPLVSSSEWLRLPGTEWINQPALERFFEEALGVPPHELARLLEQGVGAGLLHAREGGIRVFDFSLLRNWLSEQTGFRQHCYLHSLARSHSTERLQGNADAPGVRLRWVGSYDLSIPAELLVDDEHPWIINLPLPLETPLQRDVEVSRWIPPELARYRQPGMIVGYPISACRDSLHLGYEFSCLVDEWSGGPRQYDPHLQAFKQPSFPPEVIRHLEGILKCILNGRHRSMEARARIIYDWLLDETHYKTFPGPDYLTALTGLGSCIQLTRLFVNLCQLAGVPARERHGAPFYALGPKGSGVSVDSFTPFAHTWAEVYVEERGWLPVETRPVAHGTREVTPWNFPDVDVRRKFGEETGMFDRYYFGNLDPYRIHGSPYLLDLPTIATFRRGSWQPVADNLRIRHRLAARFEREDPRGAA